MIHSLYFLLILSTSCTSNNQANEFDIVLESIPQEIESEPKKSIERLQKITATNPHGRKMVQDVFYILEAENLEMNGDLEGALQAWLNAVRISKGRFSKATTERWLSLYKKILGEPFKPEILARIALNDTRNGSDSEFLLKNGFTNVASLSEALKDIFKKSEETPAREESIDDALNGIPITDPLLDQLSQSYCGTSLSQKTKWNRWLTTLSDSQKQFFEAKVAECKKQHEKALKLYESASINLKEAKDIDLRIHAAERTLQIYRSNGSRVDAANAYISLMDALDTRPDTTLPILGETPLQFRLRHINHALSAARHRAMVGDYIGAKNYVQRSFELISKSFIQYPNLSKAEKRKLLAFKADAHHTLAFRISVEQGDLEGAYAQNRLALENSAELDQEWKDRLQWFSGLYLWISNNHDQAILEWEKLLKESQEELKPQILLWLSRLWQKKDPNRSQQYLDQLVKTYPLSFYSTIAPQILKIKTPTLAERFASPSTLKSLLKTKKIIAPELRSPDLNLATTRAEILAKSDLNEWSKLAIAELQASLRKFVRLEDRIEPYLVLSRLFYRNGDYNQAIYLTTQLAQSDPQFWQKYPEQILLYFSKPYSTIIKRASVRNFLEEEWVFSIIRQESGFRPTVESPAGAIGLMQLVPPTAKRFAAKNSIDPLQIPKKLLEPEANIELGSNYLRSLAMTYRGFEPAIFSAYNAGEYVVDGWLKNRRHSDLLTWIELIPFGETKSYLRNVWRNVFVYKYLQSEQTKEIVLNLNNGKKS